MKRCRWKAPRWTRTCQICHAKLLEGEDASFCCNNGKWVAPPLPPLPTNLSRIVKNSPTKTELSSRSRSLNNLFCFTAIGATQGFQRFDTGPASVAITGRMYHRLFDIADKSQALNWFLYDSGERDRHATKYAVPSDWSQALKDDLRTVNRYVHDLRQFTAIPEPEPCALELSDVGQNGDFAALLHAANSTSIKPRSVVVWRNRDAEPTFMPIYSRHYEPLQYPLLFPHGTPGWGLTEMGNGQYENTLALTQKEWYHSRILSDDRFLTFGRLTCEYLCDMFSRMEEERLNFIRKSKRSIARNDPREIDVDDAEQTDISLPSSFMGSRKWASEQTADSLALARTYGPPSLFITMTCNPDWPEIKSALLTGQQACDTPVIVARAFKNRLQRLYYLLRSKMGSITYMTSSIEFQKRGLPHSHIVIQVREIDNPKNSTLLETQVRPELPVHEIDCIVKAHLPRDNPVLRAKIRRFMTHNRDHLTREVSRCRKGGKCVYGFPHPITSQTSVDAAGHVVYRRFSEEDRWIAPHIPELIDELDCHIFVDVVFTVTIFTYLYKYLYKGPDHTRFRIGRVRGEAADETKDYVEARYLSAPEAAWRILGFHVISKTPSVSCLPVHLPDKNFARFSGSNISEDTTSLLIRYFNRPRDAAFKNVTYCDYFKDYVLYKWTEGDTLPVGNFLETPILHSVRHRVAPRQVGTKVARLHMVSPTAGEVFYVRCLLARKPAASFDDLRTIDGILYHSFHEAAIRIGLFTNENEGHYVMVEAVESYCSPFALRFLFSRVVLENYPARPLWDRFRTELARDYIISTQSDELGFDQALKAIADNVRDGGRTLTDYGLPEPQLRNREVVLEQEFYTPRASVLLNRARTQFLQMNVEQKNVFTSVVLAATAYAQLGTDNDYPFFVEGKPGRGKSFVVDAICNQLRGQKFIVLIVGSSALAATLYEGGRTAHNLFQIPVVDVSVWHLRPPPQKKKPLISRTTSVYNRPLSRFLIGRN